MADKIDKDSYDFTEIMDEIQKYALGVCNPWSKCEGHDPNGKIVWTNINKDSFADPCHCGSFYKCDSNSKNNIQKGKCRSQSILQSQSFDVKYRNCTEKRVNCEKKRPWTRCIDYSRIPRNVNQKKIDENMEEFCNPKPVTNKYTPKSTSSYRPFTTTRNRPFTTTRNYRPFTTTTDPQERSRPQDADDSGGDNTAAIVGGVVGGLMVIVLLVAIFIFLRKRKAKQNEQKGASRPETKRTRTSSFQDDEEIYDSIDERAVQLDAFSNPDYMINKDPGITATEHQQKGIKEVNGERLNNGGFKIEDTYGYQTPEEMVYELAAAQKVPSAPHEQPSMDHDTHKYADYRTKENPAKSNQ